MANISIQLHERLDGVQKHFDLFDHVPAPALEPRPENPTSIDPLHFESTILDGIPVRTRAGLFVYFNAAVSTATNQRCHFANSAALWETTDRRSQNSFISQRALCRESYFLSTKVHGKIAKIF